MNIDWSKAPEDATHYLRETDDVYECWIKPGFSMRCNFQDSWVKDSTVEKDIEDGVAIRRPTAWTGTGLPPVDSRCEYIDSKGQWLKCEVVAHRNNAAVILDDHYECALVPACELRPIRTQEQIEAEERENAVDDMYETVGNIEIIPTWRDALFALYDAGYRKQPKEGA